MTSALNRLDQGITGLTPPPTLDDQIRALIPQIIPQLVEAAVEAGLHQPGFTLDFKLSGRWAMPVTLGRHAVMLELFGFLQKTIGSQHVSALLQGMSDKKYCRLGHPNGANWVVTCTGTVDITHLSLRYTRPGHATS